MKWALSLLPPASAAWYDGIDSIMILDPSQSKTVDWQGLYGSKRKTQFDDGRLAVLLTAGRHDVDIGVGYYMSLHGVGKSREDVVLNSFYSLDYDNQGTGGGATQNFWRSVDGVTTTAESMTWATSQACPVRRSHIKGEITLSETGDGVHWSSGGFMGDTQIDGLLHCGTQQQFFFRNDAFLNSTDCEAVTNGAFIGSTGHGSGDHISKVPQTPDVAEKPYLVEESGGWSVVVPSRKRGTSGISDDRDGAAACIPFSEVFVAQASHSAADIQSGIEGKKVLLFTPGVYELAASITIMDSDFVVLGIGFPTLVPRTADPAIVVHDGAQNVRVAAVLFEAGYTETASATQPMLEWRGPMGVASDIFSRVGSYPGRDCAVTRADTHVRIAGAGTVLDNTWMWHGDHDDCNGNSDSCIDAHGLVVDADDVTAYGLKAEHMFDNHVEWNGNNGATYFFQCELPYHQPTFGSSNKVGYQVADSVQSHLGVALGVYIIFDEMQHAVAFRAPASATFQNIVAWCVTGSAAQFEHLLCQGDTCYDGECSYNQCRLDQSPAAALEV